MDIEINSHLYHKIGTRKKNQTHTKIIKERIFENSNIREVTVHFLLKSLYLDTIQQKKKKKFSAVAKLISSTQIQAGPLAESTVIKWN